MSVIGYARVSTHEQSLDAQVEQLRAAGCERVFSEKVSGKSRKAREELEAMLADLRPGDVVIVSRLDRLARSTMDLLNILHAVEARGAQFKSLADSWCDTSSPHGRLMTTILGALAEFERSLILARTSAGTARARAMGVKIGRKSKLDSRMVQSAAERRSHGETVAEIAKDIGVHHKTLRKALRRAA